jgi:hypothetical protein
VKFISNVSFADILFIIIHNEVAKGKQNEEETEEQEAEDDESTDGSENGPEDGSHIVSKH